MSGPKAIDGTSTMPMPALEAEANRAHLHPIDPDAAPMRSTGMGIGERAVVVAERIRGVVAGASLSVATAMSGAGATCATGRCGQGCGYACGIIGVAAAGGIAVTALRRRLQGNGPSTP